MRKLGLIFVLMVFIFSERVESTRAEGKNEVKLFPPAAKPGAILVKGTYSLAPGHTLMSILVLANPAGNRPGEGGEGLAKVQGNIYTVTITVPPGANYDVRAIMTLVDQAGTEVCYFTTEKSVVVPVVPKKNKK